MYITGSLEKLVRVILLSYIKHFICASRHLPRFVFVDWINAPTTRNVLSAHKSVLVAY